MADLDKWLAPIFAAIAATFAGAIGGLFLRLRTLENRRAAADVRISALEGAETPDFGDRLDRIDERLRKLETRTGTLGEVSAKVDGLARSLSGSDRALGEMKGTIGELRSLVHSINGYLRGGK